MSRYYSEAIGHTVGVFGGEIDIVKTFSNYFFHIYKINMLYRFSRARIPESFCERHVRCSIN